jgi:hypothetical protein
MADIRPAAAWKFPIRAAADIVVMLLGLLLATWPLIALVVLLKLVF